MTRTAKQTTRKHGERCQECGGFIHGQYSRTRCDCPDARCDCESPATQPATETYECWTCPGEMSHRGTMLIPTYGRKANGLSSCRASNHDVRPVRSEVSK